MYSAMIHNRIIASGVRNSFFVPILTVKNQDQTHIYDSMIHCLGSLSKEKYLDSLKFGGRKKVALKVNGHSKVDGLIN